MQKLENPPRPKAINELLESELDARGSRAGTGTQRTRRAKRNAEKTTNVKLAPEPTCDLDHRSHLDARRVLVGALVLSSGFAMLGGCARIHAGMDEKDIRASVDREISPGMPRDVVQERAKLLARADKPGQVESWERNSVTVYLRNGFWRAGNITFLFDPENRLDRYEVHYQGAWP